MSNSLDFLYLNEKDMIAAGVKDMGGCIEAMENALSLLRQGDYRMGGPEGNEHGIKLCFPKSSDIKDMPLDGPDRRLFAMPAYLGGKYHVCGIKCYGSNQKNREKGLPRSILMFTLMDVETGAPIAYMSANILSAMRTGALSGLGTKYLCSSNVKTVSIIGPGVMGKYAMSAFMETQKEIDTVKIKGRSRKGIDGFIDYCKNNYPSIKNYIVCDSVEEASKDSDIIYFGTTNAARFEDNPYLNGEWIKPGATVISASALLMDTDFIGDKNKCKLIADNFRMYEEWGANQPRPVQKNVSTLLGMCFYDAVLDGKVKKEDITNMGDIIDGLKQGRDNENQITVYAVGGMPIEDVAWGYECYLNAKARNIGLKLNLWDKSEL